MQTVVTLPVLQAISDSTDHYLGLQPIIKGRTNAEYVNSNLRFNPSSNTLTLNANLNLRKGSVSLDALSANVLPLTGGTVTGNLRITGNTFTVASPTTFQNEVSVANNFSFNSGYGSSAVAYGCRAWCYFNNSQAIVASGNFSSVTVNGTGDIWLNFINNMPDANYATLATTNEDGGTVKMINATQSAINRIRIVTFNLAGTKVNNTYNFVAIIR
jgi:hypothetical protein